MQRRMRRLHIRTEVILPPTGEDARDGAAGPSRLPTPADAPAPLRREAEDDAGQSGEHLGVYVISVTARILRMHPQTLRKYERLGLVSPSRSEGMVRYYSDHDLSRLRMIKHLVEDRGMNLAGVELALEMVERLHEMQRALEGQPVGVTAALEGQVQSVLELLHYAQRGRRPAVPGVDVDPPAHP